MRLQSVIVGQSLNTPKKDFIKIHKNVMNYEWWKPFLPSMMAFYPRMLCGLCARCTNVLIL